MTKCIYANLFRQQILRFWSQLPTLPQQHVIIMGDCVRTPVVARMNTAKPLPNSNNPEIIKNWLVEDKIDYQEVVDKWLEKKKEVD